MSNTTYFKPYQTNLPDTKPYLDLPSTKTYQNLNTDSLPTKVVLPTLSKPTAPTITTPQLPGQTSGSASNSEEETSTNSATVFDIDNFEQTNSIVDVLFNSVDPVDNGGKLFSFKYLYSEGWDLIKNLLPQFGKDNWGTAFLINNFVNLAETLDIFANAIKAIDNPYATTAKNIFKDENGNMIPTTWLYRLDTATGGGVVGRYNYDYETTPAKDTAWHRFLAKANDFALEFFADPLNLIELGTGTILKATALPLASQSAKLTSSVLGGSMLDDLDINKIVKRHLKGIVSGTDDAMEEFAEAYARKVIRELKKTGAYSDLLDTTTKSALKAKYVEIGRKVFMQAEEVVTKSTNINIITTLYRLGDAADKMDSFIQSVAGGPVFTPVIHLIKHHDVLSRYITKSMQSAMSPYTVDFANGNKMLNITQVDDILHAVNGNKGQFRQTRKVTEDALQPVEDMVAESMSHSITATVLWMTKVIDGFDVSLKNAMTSKDLKQLIDELHTIIKQATGGSCATISEYLASYEQALLKCPLITDYVSDGLIATLRQLVHVEDDLTNAITKSSIIKDFQDYVMDTAVKNLQDISKEIQEVYKKAQIDDKAHVFDISGFVTDTNEVLYDLITNIDDINERLGMDKSIDITQLVHESINTVRRCIYTWDNNISFSDDYYTPVSEISELITAITNLNNALVRYGDYLKQFDVKQASDSASKIMDASLGLEARAQIVYDILNKIENGPLHAQLGDASTNTTNLVESGYMTKQGDIPITQKIKDTLYTILDIRPDFAFEHFYDLIKDNDALSKEFLSGSFTQVIHRHNILDLQEAITKELTPYFNLIKQYTQIISETEATIKVIEDASGKLNNSIPIADSYIRQLQKKIDTYKSLILQIQRNPLYRTSQESMAAYTKESLDIGDLIQRKAVDYIVDFTFANVKTDTDVEAYFDAIDTMLGIIQDIRTEITSDIFGSLKSDTLFDLENESDLFEKAVTSLNELQKELYNDILSKRTLEVNDKAYIQFRTERFMQTFRFITGKLPESLFNMFDITSNDGIATLKYMAQLPDDSNLKKLLLSLQEQTEYLQFQNDFILATKACFSNDQIWYAFMQTFQNYSQGIAPAEMLDRNKIFSFIKKMQTNLDSVRGISPRTLDHYREYLDNDMDFFRTYFDDSLFKVMREQGHDNPGSDVLLTKYALFKDAPQKKLELDNWIKANPDKRICFFDIETVEQFDASVESLNRYTGQTAQIALMDYTTNTPIVFRLKALDEAGYYKQADGVNIIYVDGGEYELYKTFDEHLKVGNVERLIGSNTSSFDIPFINYRWKQIERDPDISENLFLTSKYKQIISSASDAHIDVLNLLRENQGIPVLSPNDVDTVYATIYTYASNVIDMGHTVNMQDIHPQKLIHTLREINNEVGASYDLIKYESNEVRNKYIKDYNTFNRLFGNVYSYTDDYEDIIKNSLGRNNYTTFIARNVFAENANSEKLMELADLIVKNNPNLKGISDKDKLDLIIDACTSNKVISKEDLQLLLTGDETAPGFDIAQAKISNWWREQMLYYSGLANPGESFEDFRARILNGRTQLASMQQLLQNEAGDISFINYTNKLNNTYQKYFKLQKGTRIYDKLARRILNKTTQIDSLINYGIKNEDAIFNITLDGYTDKLFNNFDELKDTVKHIIDTQHELKNTNSWVYYIDLDNFKTPKQYFALWYVINTEKKYLNAGDILSVSRNLKANDIDQIKHSVFESIANSVFDNYMYKSLYDMSQDGYEVIDMARTVADSSLSALQRTKKLYEALDTLPESGAKQFAIMQAEDPIIKISRRLQSLGSAAERSYIKHINSIDDLRIKANSIDYIQSATSDLHGPDFLISDLIFNDQFKCIHLYSKLQDKILYGDDKTYSDLTKLLISKKDEYAKYGIGMFISENRLYLYLNNPYELVADYDRLTATYMGRDYIPNAKQFIKLPYNAYIPDDDIDAINKILEFSARHENYAGFGYILKQDGFTNLYNSLPEEVKQVALTPDQLAELGYFKQLRFDTSDIGPMSLRVRRSDAFINYFKSYDYILKSIKDQDLYTVLLFNKANGFNFDADGIFKGLSDKEIIQYLKDQDAFIPVRLVQDKSIQGYHMARVHIYDAKDLQIAREQNVVLVPYQVYSTSFIEINTNKRASNLAKKGVDFFNMIDEDLDIYLKHRPKYYAAMSMYAYKLGYLASPATWGRNVIDSNLKAIIDTKDPTGMITNTYKADRLLKGYDDIMKKIFPKDSPTEFRYNTTGFKKYFAKCRELGIETPISEGEFFAVRGFIINGPSAGESQYVLKWLADQSKNAAPKSFTFNNFLGNIGSLVLTPMNYIESRVRLAEYLTLIDQGFTTTEAFIRVSKTAFDYSTKTKVEKLIEHVIPFYKFQELNFMYWLNTFTERPDITRLLTDLTEEEWDSYETTYDDWATNQSVLYNMSNGNLLLDNDTGLTLKLNPSYMDFLNTITDPKQSIMDSVFAPLHNFIEYVDDTIEDRQTQKQLQDGTYEIGFGKLKGQPVSALLEPENLPYAQWALTQDWMYTQYKPVYDYLIANKAYEDPKMPISKYKGQSVQNVPVSSKVYFLSQDWFHDRYPYICDIWTGKYDTVIPREDIATEPVLSSSEVEGIFASGLFKNNSGAMDFVESVLGKTVKDLSTYPVIGVLAQKYFNENSTAKNNYTRLQNKPIEAIVASILPGTFGAVKTYEDFKTENEYYSDIPTLTSYRLDSPYTYYTKRYYAPGRSKNYYYTQTNKYSDSRYRLQFEKTRFNIKKAQYNVYRLDFH